MGIKALKFTSVDRYVSDLDSGKNATVTNQADIDSWKKSKAKDRGPEPEPKFEHSPEATVWLLGTLDSITMAALSDDLTSIGAEGGLVLRNADNDITAARLGIKGWENWNDDDGNPLVFKTEELVVRGRKVDALTEELVEMIPIPVLRELGREIKRRNSMDMVEAKNSVSASLL